MLTLQPVFLLGGLEQGAGRISCCECHKTPNTPKPVTFDLESLPGELVQSPFHDEFAVEKHKNLTERYLVKRVNSASVVEVKVGLVRGNCSSGDWRSRSVSVSGYVNKPLSRVRLISTDDLHGSLHRLQSHHSSSGEEWFEEDDVTDSKSTSTVTTRPKPPKKFDSELQIEAIEPYPVSPSTAQSLQFEETHKIPIKTKKSKNKVCCLIS